MEVFGVFVFFFRFSVRGAHIFLFLLFSRVFEFSVGTRGVLFVGPAGGRELFPGPVVEGGTFSWSSRGGGGTFFLVRPEGRKFLSGPAGGWGGGGQIFLTRQILKTRGEGKIKFERSLTAR